MRMHRRGRSTGPALAVALAGAVAVLSGCGDGGPSRAASAVDIPDIRGPEDVPDAYAGLLDEAFYEDMDAYSMIEVTLLGDVDEVLTPRVFTLTSPDGDDVGPVLVVTAEGAGEVPVDPGAPLLVAATPVRDFEAEVVAAELGLDLQEERYEQWEGETFLVATVVEPAS